MKTSAFACAALLVLTGCANTPQQKYAWGDYEQSMYSYYKNPANSNEFQLSLERTIKEAEAANSMVAPGLYAEFGYLLMLQGRQQEAIANFEKERRKWPESANLMDKMTKLAQSNPATKGDKK